MKRLYGKHAIVERLCRSEAEEHVETHRYVVCVVGDVEAYQFVVLSVLTLYEREHEATELLFRVLHLKSLLPLVFQP